MYPEVTYDTNSTFQVKGSVKDSKVKALSVWKADTIHFKNKSQRVDSIPLVPLY